MYLSRMFIEVLSMPELSGNLIPIFTGICNPRSSLNWAKAEGTRKTVIMRMNRTIFFHGSPPKVLFNLQYSTLFLFFMALTENHPDRVLHDRGDNLCAEPYCFYGTRKINNYGCALHS